MNTIYLFPEIQIFMIIYMYKLEVYLQILTYALNLI